MSRASLPRRLAIIAALVALPAALVSCTAAAPAAPEGLSARIQQGRLDVEARRLVVLVENTGSTDLTIERLVFASPAFDDEMVHEEPFELDAGRALAIRIDLADSNCDVPAESGTVRLGVVTPAGRTTAELAPEDPFDTLARIGDTDCLAESVASIATITMPDHLRSTGSGTERRAFVDVLVEPAASGSDSLVIDRVYGTTLLSAEDGNDWPLGTEVAAGDAARTISLPVRPARCDAHALADDKRGTILPFEISTSDARSGRFDRPSGTALKAELYAYYVERCGL